MKTVTTTRIVLEKHEREIAKTWGSDWSRMKKDQQRLGHFTILFGDWSGYSSGQSRVTHCQYLWPKDAENLKLSCVQFTDGTTMSVWKVEATIEQLLAKRWVKILGYSSLLEKAMKTGESYYQV